MPNGDYSIPSLSILQLCKISNPDEEPTVAVVIMMSLVVMFGVIIFICFLVILCRVCRNFNRFGQSRRVVN